VAGSAVKWARDQLGIIKSSNEIGELASKVKGTFLVIVESKIRYRRSSFHHSILGALGAILAK